MLAMMQNREAKQLLLEKHNGDYIYNEGYFYE